MPHIICCVKQVPDPETPSSQFRVDGATKKVLPVPGIQPVPSQFDTIGVEAAMRITDKVDETTVTVLSVGPDRSRDSIKHCLAMAADEGVQVNGPALNEARRGATASALARTTETVGTLSSLVMVSVAFDGAPRP